MFYSFSNVFTNVQDIFIISKKISVNIVVKLQKITFLPLLLLKNSSFLEVRHSKISSVKSCFLCFRLTLEMALFYKLVLLKIESSVFASKAHILVTPNGRYRTCLSLSIAAKRTSRGTKGGRFFGCLILFSYLCKTTTYRLKANNQVTNQFLNYEKSNCNRCQQRHWA